MSRARFRQPYLSNTGEYVAEDPVTRPFVRVRRVANGYIVDFDEPFEHEVEDLAGAIKDRINRELTGAPAPPVPPAPQTKKVIDMRRVEFYCKDARAIGRVMQRATRAIDAAEAVAEQVQTSDLHVGGADSWVAPIQFTPVGVAAQQYPRAGLQHSGQLTQEEVDELNQLKQQLVQGGGPSPGGVVSGGPAQPTIVEGPDVGYDIGGL